MPRAAARFRIPKQALGLKEYFSGTESSKICDKRESSTTLGRARSDQIATVIDDGLSPKLRVMYSPSNAPVSHFRVEDSCAWPGSVFRQRHKRRFRLRDPDDFGKDRLEVFSFVVFPWAAECSVYVFPDKVPWTDVFSCSAVLFIAIPHFLCYSDLLLEKP